MTTQKKHMVIALMIAAIFIVFNIFAVSHGVAEKYYTHIEDFMSNVVHSS